MTKAKKQKKCKKPQSKKMINEYMWRTGKPKQFSNFPRGLFE